MGAFNIGITTVINDDAAYVHESFSTVGVGTTENKKITDSEATSSGLASANDSFGGSVAVRSGRIVVGVPGDDDNASNSGSACIFDLDGNQLEKITASNGAANHQFGFSVAVGSGRIVVGAPFGSNAYQGSAYIFDLDGNQSGIITASDGASYDLFGYSVAAGCGRIVVGARDAHIGSNSDQGAAYIYDLDGSNEVKITASDGAANDEFGYSVAVGCGRIVVGAYLDDVGSNTNQGSAYIFDLNGNQLGIITASDGAALDRFGYSVAVGDGRIVVGAPYDKVGNVGINTEQGSAYIFDLNGNQLGIITASDGVAYDLFGRSVAVGSGMIVVGTPGSTLSGVDITHAEIAYIYDLDGNNEVKISHSDRRDSGGSVAKDAFGSEVAAGCGRIVVGAPLNYGPDRNSGSAYIFNLPEDSNTYWERVLEEYRY